MVIPFKEPLKDFYRERAEPKFIFDYLPKEHPVFVYADILWRMDTSEIEAKYSPIGQNAYHPKMMMGLLVYSYSQGVFSSREMASKCRIDIGFMYMSWMLQPDHRTISDFRKNNLEAFKKFFKASALVAKEVGLVHLGHVSLDGSKVKAATSKHKAMSYGRMQKKEKEIMQEIEALLERVNQVDQAEDSQLGEQSGEEISEELGLQQKRLEKIQQAKAALEQREGQINPGKEIDGKKQISFADTDARIMGKKGTFDYAYNAQISVESSNQIIVGEHVSQEANDKKEAKPALEQIENTLGEQPEKMSMDNGYASAENIATVAEKQIDGYIAMGREGKTRAEIENSERKITKADFVYEREKDQYRCPEGKTLELKRVGTDGSQVYQAQASDCQACVLRSRCTTSDQGRTLSVDAGEPVRRAMQEKMEKPESKEIYSKRKTIVEPVYGVIKSVMGFVEFSLRGMKKVCGEWSLVCGTYNIKKVVKAIVRGVVCLYPRKPGVAGAISGVDWERIGAFLMFLLRVLVGRSCLTVLDPFRTRSSALSYSA